MCKIHKIHKNETCVDNDVLEKYGSCERCREVYEDLGVPTLCEISDGWERAPIDLIMEGYGDDFDRGENQNTDETPYF